MHLFLDYQVCGTVPGYHKIGELFSLLAPGLGYYKLEGMIEGGGIFLLKNDPGSAPFFHPFFPSSKVRDKPVQRVGVALLRRPHGQVRRPNQVKNEHGAVLGRVVVERFVQLGVVKADDLSLPVVPLLSAHPQPARVVVLTSTRWQSRGFRS